MIKKIKQFPWGLLVFGIMLIGFPVFEFLYLATKLNVLKSSLIGVLVTGTILALGMKMGMYISKK
ncbi:MAG: hypothetical protein EBZ49_00655 [Proteobacteria bacterium]|nr:hypothetical protein [Pseudomonadota bacterium]